MNNLISDELLVELKEFISNQTILNIQEFHSQKIVFIENYAIRYESWKKALDENDDKMKQFLSASNHHRELEADLHSEKDLLKNELVFKQYQILQERFEQKFEKIESETIINQGSENFTSTSEDTIIIKQLKKIKKITFDISDRIHKINKKNKQEFSWKRKIPLKNLMVYHFEVCYLKNFLKSYEDYIESVGKIIIDLLRKQKEIDKLFINKHIQFLNDSESISFEESFASLIPEIDSTKEKLEIEYQRFKTTIIKNLEDEFDKLRSDSNIVGTIELSSNKFSNSQIDKALKNQQKLLENAKKNWTNYILAVFDRKEYYEDLLWFVYLLLGDSYRITKYGAKFIKEEIEPSINSIQTEIQNSINNINENSTDFTILIDQVKDKLNLTLDQNIVPKLVSVIGSNNFLREYSKYKKDMDAYLNELDKEYTFVKPKDLFLELDDKQLKKFSPREIIFPIILNKLNISMEEELEDFGNKLSSLNSHIIGISRIIEFNLDAAKGKFVEEKSSREESIPIAMEGLKRADSKAKDIKIKTEKDISELSAKFENILQSLLEDLLDLTDINHLIKIKLQVSKEKAAQELKENFRESSKKIQIWYRWSIQRLTKVFFASKEKVIGISSKVGLTSADSELSEAMADYLVRVSDSINQLPYVYQRLFSNEQLTDDRMFEGRTDEIEKFGKAISYWSKNQTSSVMIIGEKGSGTSSLINVGIKKYLLDKRIYRKEFSGTLFSEEKLLNILCEVFEFENIINTDHFIFQVNSLEEKRIVVIENIEDFFIRTVDGFSAIKVLLEIITATNNKTLWITTCNLYAWVFLNKVMNIKDYFIFNIKLKEITEKVIEKIILSRHNVSGYKLLFSPSAEIASQKSYKKMTEDEKQKYLCDYYFNHLYDLTSNNIAVALFYWLRSIVGTTEEQIEISVDFAFDFSFLNALSDQKLFSLSAIILHDGLSAEEHSIIFRNKIKESQLLFSSLSDDGIIFKRGTNYKINFQLYTPLIKSLKDKNILH